MAGSLIVCILLAEVLLAVFLPMPTYNRMREVAPAMFLPSNTLPYRLKPNYRGRLLKREFDTAVHINSLGYRGEEFDIEKGKKFRILAVGDSFTFGYGVNNSETYPAELQRQVRAHTKNMDIQVINAGFAAGYYPDTYYLYIKNIGLKLKPDLLLLGFFIGNDIDHAQLGENVWTKTDEDGLPLVIDAQHVRVDEENYLVPTPLPRRYRLPVLRNSQLMQLAALAYHALRANRYKFFNYWICRRDYLERTEKAVGTIQTLMLGISQVAAEHGVPLVVVMIPAREQIRPSEFAFDEIPFMQGHDLLKPQRIFAQFFQDNGIDHIDLLPSLKRRPSGDALYYPEDTHFTRVGNEVAGRLIADYLFSSGLIPNSASPSTKSP